MAARVKVIKANLKDVAWEVRQAEWRRADYNGQCWTTEDQAMLDALRKIAQGHPVTLAEAKSADYDIFWKFQ